MTRTRRFCAGALLTGAGALLMAACGGGTDPVPVDPPLPETLCPGDSTSTITLNPHAPCVSCAPPDEFVPILDSPTWRTIDQSSGDFAAALEQAIDAGARVVFIAAGSYTLNRTVRILDATDLTIIGQKPEATTISWGGVDGGVMLQIIDSINVKLSRLTFDGGRTGERPGAEIIAQVLQSNCYTDSEANSCCNLPVTERQGRPVYGLEFSDDRFQNARAGIVLDHGYTSPQDQLPVGTFPCQPDQDPQACKTTPDCPAGQACVDEQCVCSPDAGCPSSHTCVAGQCVSKCQLSDCNADVPPGVIPVVNSNIGNGVIRRSEFSGLTNYGVVSANQNALVWLVADSTFANVGPSGEAGLGAGIAHLANGSYVIVNNTFKDSNRDIVLWGGGSDVIRGNVSLNSNEFLWTSAGVIADVSGNYIVVSGEKVAKPVVDGTQGIANECSASGLDQPRAICFDGAALTLLDNYIQIGIDGGVDGRGVFHQDNPRIVTGNNRFQAAGTIDDFIVPWGYQSFSASILQVEPDYYWPDPPVAAKIAKNFQEHTGAKEWSATPPLTMRPHLNVATDLPTNDPDCPNADCTSAFNTGCACAINKWLASASQGWALYFPALPNGGVYYLETTLEIPSGLDVTILGDGYGSVLEWNGPEAPSADTSVVHFQAVPGRPALGTLRDLTIVGVAPLHGPVDGVLIDALDSVDQNGQPLGDTIYLDQVNADFADRWLDADGVDNTIVRADQSGGGSANLKSGIHVAGGGAAYKSGENTIGLRMFAGSVIPLADWASVDTWGKAVLIGTDNEGGTAGFTLDANGYFTLAGGRFYAGAQSRVVIGKHFDGRATFMNLDDHALLDATSNSGAGVLALNLIASDHLTPNACEFIAMNPDARDAGLHVGAFNTEPGIVCTSVPASSMNQCLQTGGAGCDYWKDCDTSDGSCTTGIGQEGALVKSVKPLVTDLRETLAVRPPVPCGAANVRLHRVNILGDMGDTRTMRTAVRVVHRP